MSPRYGLTFFTCANTLIKKSLSPRFLQFCIFLFILLFFAGCAKKYGCREYHAVNKNNDSEKSDGSCFYFCKTGFHWSGIHADSLISLGHSYLNIYIDNVLIGSDSTKNHYHGFHSVESFDGIVFTDTMYVEEQSYFLQVTNQDQQAVHESVITLYGSDQMFKIRYFPD